ncbi:MAG: 4'-phosphopantetheinyl transferase superfamily protein [Firmicutes bacterium]|nr:4'-phosphopantetheinyl transferase superfamily protein [Bacillota bacterium]
MTELHIISTDTVRCLDLNPLWSVMPERKKKYEHLKMEGDRLLCAGGGILMTNAVGIESEKDLIFSDKGKPILKGGPAFNLSHSGKQCVLAIGESNVGVDIEVLDISNLDIASAVYTNSEQEWMAEDNLDRFHKLWTWKESVMKATGLGMSLHPKSFEVLPFYEDKGIYVENTWWYAFSGKLKDSCFSVCSNIPIKNLVIWEWIQTPVGLCRRPLLF